MVILHHLPDVDRAKKPVNPTSYAVNPCSTRKEAVQTYRIAVDLLRYVALGPVIVYGGAPRIIDCCT